MGESGENGVAACYRDKSVFIIGGSGFLGKVLIEKLLYSCPGINKVYILMRDKPNATGQQRVNKMLNLPVFSRLQKEKPWVMEKVAVVTGDLTSSNLGLSERDEQEIIENVSYVFHLGATVKFNDPIEIIYKINVDGTERVIDLCKRMKHIQKLVYVSTAFSNSNQALIEERIYPLPFPLKALKKQILRGLNSKEVEKLLDGRPNTYTFTKAIAEALINENRTHIPTVIIRPSIVVSSIKEPFEGWIDSWSGANSVVWAIGLGVTRVLRGKYNHRVDFIPVDYVINLTIVAATTDTNLSDEVAVYNSSSSELNPVELQNVNKYIIGHSVENKVYKRSNPSVSLSMSPLNIYFLKLWKEILPMYLNDVKVYFKGEKGRYMELINKIHLVEKQMVPFIATSWLIRAQKTKALFLSLPQRDRDAFPFNPEDIDWAKFMYVYCSGIKEHLKIKSKY